MMTDPIVLAKALAAAKVNVKGTGQAPRPAPSAAEEADRTPNWNKWRPRLIPHIDPEQCAALWANIDPDKLKLIRNAWMAEGSVHRFDESQEFKDRLVLVEANQYGVLKSQGKVDLRVFAAGVREAQKEGWTAPAELLAMAEESDPGKQKTPMSSEDPDPLDQPRDRSSAEEHPADEHDPPISTNGTRRAHNKRDTEARYSGWQARINQLAETHPTKNHSDLCRKLAMELGDDAPSFQTIRKNTRLRRRQALL